MFLNINREQAAKQSDGGSYINKSGIYDITLLAPIVETNSKGAQSLNFYVDYADNAQVVYSNLKLQNNDGSENFEMETVMKLLAVSEVDGVADPVEATLPIGPAKADKDVLILEDLTDIDLKMRVQMQYSVYNGDIKERKTIKGFYRADGASAAEVLNDTEVGVQLAKDEKYAENVTYKDGLTEEDVTKWVQDDRPKGSFGGATGSTGGAAQTAPKRRFGAKK
jgi:hypothetical protein